MVNSSCLVLSTTRPRRGSLRGHAPHEATHCPAPQPLQLPAEGAIAVARKVHSQDE